MYDNLPSESFSLVLALILIGIGAAIALCGWVWTLSAAASYHGLKQRTRYLWVSLGFLVNACGLGMTLWLYHTDSYRAYIHHHIHDDTNPVPWIHFCFWVYTGALAFMAIAAVYNWHRYTPCSERFRHWTKKRALKQNERRLANYNFG